MNLPLSKRLPRREFVNLAELQDRFIDSIYSFERDFVIHGGTAIWRCYKGNRFSYDIDGYVQSGLKMGHVSRELAWALSKGGAKLDKARRIGRAIVAQVSNQDTQLKVEIGIRKIPRKVVREYERVDGTFTSVLTLTPEDLILEKVRAYSGRQYMRDLYDIYHLIGQVTEKRHIRAKLSRFIRSINPPTNQSELPMVIYSGVSPTYDRMVDYIRASLE